MPMLSRAPSTAAGHFGRLDGLANNAGRNISIPFPTWRRSTPPLLHQPPRAISCAGRAPTKASGSGRIVNIASVASIRGSSIGYATSKASFT
jgi:NAD(P)-dependent dehydrogenase (short-subunit alcohol dehydrogenase family)